MLSVREVFQSTPPKQTPFSKEFLEWTKEVRRRCSENGYPAPPFTFYKTLYTLEGSDGVAIAIHHSNDNSMVYSNKLRAHSKDGQLVPIVLTDLVSQLASQSWDLSRTTILKLSWDEPLSFESLWEGYIRNQERLKASLKALGTDEIHRHMTQAFTNLQSSSPVDWGNAKAQARKALESLTMQITNKTTVKDLATGLKRRGLIGDRDREWMIRFESFLGATYALGSKKGSHKPDPTRIEAIFFVRVTSALVDYVIELLLVCS